MLESHRFDDKENWRWQLQNQIGSPQALLDWLHQKKLYARTAPDTLRAIEAWQLSYARWQGSFQFAVSPYYLGLVHWADPACPILRQFLPSPEEFDHKASESLDPLTEEEHAPLPGLTHRYPDRVLWYLSHCCAVYCRFCTRKRKVSQPASALPRRDWEAVFAYVAQHKEIKEVILSGGDPLSLSDSHIGYILKRLRQLKHLYSIRIHTRMPVTLPMRFTTALAKILGSFYPITIVSHFNHARELSPQAKNAIRLLRMNGNDVLNQAVLLSGINDTVRAQEKLNLALLAAGARPYYLHRCDEVVGTNHFRVPLAKGMDILRALRGRNPGIALPRYVVDLPGGGGKVPLEPSYFIEEIVSQTPEKQERVRGTPRVYRLQNWASQEYKVHDHW